MKTDVATTVSLPENHWVWSPKIDIFLDVSVTLGVMLDWLPGALGMNNPILASGTRLVVVPLVVFDLLRSNQKYAVNPFTWIYTLVFLVGVGGSWFLGNTTTSEVKSLLPTVLVLIFFLKSRSAQDHLRILQVMFYASLSVPLSILLAWIGILKPKQIIETAEITRVLAAVNWSALGLFTSIVPAMLGGLLLRLGPSIKRNWQAWLIAAVLLSMSFWAVMLSGQRSAGLAFFTAFGLVGALLFLRLPAGQKVSVFLGLAFFAIIFSNAFTSLAHGVAGSFITRMNELNALGDTRRMWMIDNFLHDISTTPSLIGPGSGARYADLGISNMHIIFGEAYYKGGLLFMMLLVFSFAWAGWSLLVRLIHRQYRSLYYLAAALFALLVSSGIQLTTHPGLHIRLVYLVLGLSIARVTVEKSPEKEFPFEMDHAM